MAKLLRLHSGRAMAGLTGKHNTCCIQVCTAAVVLHTARGSLCEEVQKLSLKSLCEEVQQLLCYEHRLKFKRVLALAPMHPTQVCWELCLQMSGCWPHACAASIVPRCFYCCWSHRLLFIDEFSVNNDKNINQIYFSSELIFKL